MNRFKKVWKIFKRIAFWTFFTGLFLITLTTVILHIYEDDIKAYAIAALNDQLTTDVEVENIEVSILHDFPNVSLQFEKVLIKDAYKETESNDTLLFAADMFFHFNVLDLFSGDYEVKHASMEGGQLNLITTADGDYNYDIVTPSDSTNQSDQDFRFSMERLKLEDFNFHWVNRPTGQDYELDFQDALLKGDFSAVTYDVEATGNFWVDRVKSNSLTLFSKKNGTIDLAMHIDTDQKSYTFNKGDLSVEDMNFNVSGFLDSAQIDLKIVGNNIQVEQVINSFMNDPENEKEYIGDGRVNFNSAIAGSMERTEMPSITADFSILDGQLTEPDQQLTLSNINIEGSYKNKFEKRKEQLDLPLFDFKLLNSHFSGEGSIADFDQPEFVTKAKGELDLGAFNRFFGFKGVASLGGRLKLDLSTIIRFFDPEYRKDEFQVYASNGTLLFDQVNYRGVDSHIDFREISGELIIHGKDAAANNLMVKTSRSDVLVNGAMKNLVSYIDGTGSLGMIASIQAKSIDINEFLNPSDQLATERPEMFVLPANLNLNIDLSADEILWENHIFTKVHSQVLMTNRIVTAKQLAFQSLQGAVSGQLVLENRLNEGNIVRGNVRFRDINIKTLFKEWEDFQQKSITSKHLSGQVGGNAEFVLLFNPYFSMVEEKLFAVSEITIKDGELTELETMKAITDYMRSNKALKVMLNKHIDQFEDKLMHLQFKTLTNKIEVKDRRISIPKMTIKSNAMDVDFFGWHDFDNNIEYHFSFRFRQLKSKPEYTEFGRIEDDGLGLVIYLTMSGNIDDPEFSLDKDERKNDMKETINLEKETVKSILKTDFGLFKKDSTVQKVAVDNKKEVEFIYYESDIEAPAQDSIAIKKKQKGRLGKLIEGVKEDAEKEKQKATIDIDTDL